MPEAPAPYTPSLTSFNLAFIYGEGDATEKSLGAEDFSKIKHPVNPAFIKNPLSYEEIKDYMNCLSESLSQNRTKLIYYALSSVGRVPYYWGGLTGLMSES